MINKIKKIASLIKFIPHFIKILFANDGFNYLTIKDIDKTKENILLQFWYDENTTCYDEDGEQIDCIQPFSSFTIYKENEKLNLLINNIYYESNHDELNKLVELANKLPLKNPKQVVGGDGTLYNLKVSKNDKTYEYNWWEDTAEKRWQKVHFLRDELISFGARTIEKNYDKKL